MNFRNVAKATSVGLFLAGRMGVFGQTEIGSNKYSAILHYEAPLGVFTLVKVYWGQYSFFRYAGWGETRGISYVRFRPYRIVDKDGIVKQSWFYQN